MKGPEPVVPSFPRPATRKERSEIYAACGLTHSFPFVPLEPFDIEAQCLRLMRRQLNLEMPFDVRLKTSREVEHLKEKRGEWFGRSQHDSEHLVDIPIR